MDTVTFWVGDGVKDSFLCGVNGMFTIEILKEIEKEFKDSDLHLPMVRKVTVEPIWNAERQYNNADCLDLSYWQFNVISKEYRKD